MQKMVVVSTQQKLENTAIGSFKLRTVTKAVTMVMGTQDLVSLKIN